MDENVTSAAGYAEQAFYFLERRRLHDARRVLRDGLAKFPQDPDLLFHSAQTEWLEDDHLAAEQTLRQVLVIAPAHPHARSLLAGVFTETRRFADAESLLIGMLREYPESAELYGRYALLMLRTLHLDKAERLAREGLRYDPEDRDCLLCEALCTTARSGGKSNEALSRLIVAHPESQSSVHALVNALLEGGRLSEAHRVARGALQADPANQNLVELVRELRAQNHWTMKPLWPMQKWGWGGAAGMWVGAIIVMRVLEKSAPEAYMPFAIVWVLYAVYSWVWPSIIRKLV